MRSRPGPRIAQVRTRLIVALLVVVFGVTATLVLDHRRAAVVADDQQRHLAAEADLLVESIAGVLADVETRLVAVAGLFRASTDVTRDEFALLASDLGLLHGMGGYGFAPLVAHRDLAAWEQEVAADTPGFTVFGVDESGRREQPRAVAYHAPLLMFWPEQAFGVPPIGLDLTAESVRAATLEEALRSGGTALTSFLVLLDEGDDDGFIAIHPVVDANGTSTIGFLTAPIDLSLLLDAALPASIQSELAWSVADTTGDVVGPDGATEGPVATAHIEVGDSSWAITVTHRQGSDHLAALSRRPAVAGGIAASVLAGIVVMLLWGSLDARRRRGELEAVIRAKDRFLASVSHELRSPLTGIIGFLDEVIDGPPVEASERESMISLAAAQAHEMADIIDDLITATRREGEEMAAHIECLDLAPHVERLARDLPFPVTVSGTDRAAWTMGDPVRVRQILRNLLTNADRHGRPPIHVDLAAGGDRVMVRVRDHGEGVDPDARHELFRPYRPLGDTGSQPQSLGLGLWISHRLAGRMGGTLVYEADPHPTFVLTLPAGDPAAMRGRPETGPALAVA